MAKAVRVLAVGFGVVGFVALQACVAPESSDGDVNVDVQPGATDPQGGTGDAILSVCVPVEVKAKFAEDDFQVKNPLLGNSRLAKVERVKEGRLVVEKVPCWHIETNELDMCKFATDPQHPVLPYDPIKKVGNTGHWLLGGDGNKYAQVGQKIAKDGQVHGDWVVASRVTNKTVPCVKPKGGKDSVGTATSTELAGSCVVETLLSSTNATGLKLLNVATATVCMGDSVHPDGAMLKDRKSPTIFCYAGDGAAINDLNGTERDYLGYYMTGAEHCHVTWSGSYEVPAAKRPSTKAAPYPGSVVETSKLQWRPVNDMLPIANP